MTRITRFALGHRALIVLFWLATAVTGAMTAGLTTSRMTNSFSMPGSANSGPSTSRFAIAIGSTM